MTDRRFFLLGAAAVLATPAVVRVESLMKLYVPKRRPLIYEIWQGTRQEVIPAGYGIDIGSESNNTSIWLVQWGNETPKLYPGSGNPFLTPKRKWFTLDETA